ncbi:MULTISPECIES: YSIRK-type signal peptide-containing protein [unclassified Gemella]|nr:YSIRK-type signal peptide-containing protein [Gemella sp. GL1.1]MBF0747005.1 YSIRK-type signal peptide-containing protein [Gemella sp. 19428wG2_WT2a]NYS27673.1 YSIRK-type signal peptide-containing protein [Gemella sp. GL1]TFU58853.1 YSIRK-type signal peptide-containing protein [Gemella sp. WT2a]
MEEDSKQGFAIKKYSFGLASVLVGLFFLVGVSA